jgi:hypothetical protein
MKDIINKITEKEIMIGGATKIKDDCKLYRLGNQRYVVFDGEVISAYTIKYDPSTREEIIKK